MIDIFDLTQFAPAFFKISDKSGQIVPFEFNRAQMHVHAKLENQIKTLGYVRANILKGRQQGCCYAPNMRIMTKDYKWISLSEVKVGDSIMALDEGCVSGTNCGLDRVKIPERKIQNAVVEAKAYLKKQAYAVTLSNGVVLKVTGEHRHLCKRGTQVEWKEINRCNIGDQIRAFSHPPEKFNPTYEDGWMSGILDGEGSFGAYPAARIALSQVDGPVLRRAKRYLEDRNIKYYELIDNRTKCGERNKLGDKPVHCIRVDRQVDILRILCATRPSRFVDRPIFVGKKLPKTCPGFNAWPSIISIQSIGEIEVIDLQTSAKTFICEGLVSHNSTYVAGRYFHRVLTAPGTQAFILTHMGDATRNLFAMTKRLNSHLPAGLAPAPNKDNENQLLFNRTNSGYRVGTAGSKEIGRSMTNQLMHLSEYAFYENPTEIKRGIEQTVADIARTEKIKESTANGIANAFYLDWQDAKEGKSDYINIFVPWYWQDEYTRSAEGLQLTNEEQDWMMLYSHDGLTTRHLAWRRFKLADFDGDYGQKCKGFSQEYPFTDEEAFLNSITDTFITVEPVQRARKAQVDSETALIIGVDPARGGQDKSAIIRRRGRLAYKGEKFTGLDTMQLVGKLKMIIEKERPTKMFIDCIGIGAGVVDRLNEMGYECVVGVNVARQANNPDQFLNLRAELWSEMRDWFNQDMPVQIPDDPELQKELCGLGYDYNSSGRLVIESKKDAKKRGMNSPDGADSLMLTFAYGQHAGTSSYQPNFIDDRAAGGLI